MEKLMDNKYSPITTQPGNRSPSPDSSLGVGDGASAVVKAAVTTCWHPFVWLFNLIGSGEEKTPPPFDPEQPYNTTTRNMSG